MISNFRIGDEASRMKDMLGRVYDPCFGSPGMFAQARSPSAPVCGALENLMNDLESLRDALRQFATDRDWDKFHSPKNLVSALSVEASELQEPFQWLTEEQSRHLSAAQLAAVREEIADVLIYLVRLADKLGIDPLAAAAEKLVKNAQRCPADKARGLAGKYVP